MELDSEETCDLRIGEEEHCSHRGGGEEEKVATVVGGAKVREGKERAMGLGGAAAHRQAWRLLLRKSWPKPSSPPGRWPKSPAATVPHHHTGCSSRLPFSSKSSTISIASSKKVRESFVQWYLRMIDSRPILTKAVTAGLIFTVADLSAQKISQESSEPLDLIRTSRMAVYGFLISGPSLHKWFNLLSRIFPKTDVTSTLKKIFLGQACYGPLITSIFFSYNAALQGESANEIAARLQRDLLPTLINGLIYWPSCDFITFKFIPVHLQPLVSNSFSLLWTIYLTYMASLKKAETGYSA